MSVFSFPKIQLHLHLDGSMLPETSWELAAQKGIPMPTETLEEFRAFLVRTADCRDVNEYLARFELPLQLLQDKESLARVTRELIGLLHEEGHAYAEIRFAPQLHKCNGMSQREAIEAVLEGRRQGLAACPGIAIGILLCAMSIGPETVNMEENLETVRLTREFIDLGTGVVGLDLAGAEGIVPLRNFHPVFDLARELKLPFTCHAGDSQGPDTVKDALDFGAKRLGHGHHIYEDPELVQRAIAEGVTLEICPTSNIQCCTRSSYESHPAKKLLDAGLPVTINTDNMILASVNMDDEFTHCVEEMGFAENDLIRMTIHAAKAAFLPQEEKDKLIHRLESYLE